MYIVVERCADDYFGPEAIIFLNKSLLLEYLNSRKGNAEVLPILGVYQAKDVTDYYEKEGFLK